MDNNLHLCFLLMPVAMAETLPINWTRYLHAVENLSASGKRVLASVGVRIGLIQRASHQGSMPVPVKSSPEGKTITRMFAALVVWCAVDQQVPVGLISQKFGIPRGTLQVLVQSFSAFGMSTSAFCSKLRWVSLESIIESFIRRIPIHH